MLKDFVKKLQQQAKVLSFYYVNACREYFDVPMLYEFYLKHGIATLNSKLCRATAQKIAVTSDFNWISSTIETPNYTP